jgi:hypothetical protein
MKKIKEINEKNNEDSVERINSNTYSINTSVIYIF